MANTVQYNADKADATSIRSSNRSPTSLHEAFWVPTISQQNESVRSASAGKKLNAFYLIYMRPNWCINFE